MLISRQDPIHASLRTLHQREQGENSAHIRARGDAVNNPDMHFGHSLSDFQIHNNERVLPERMRTGNSVSVNDDAGLEAEADPSGIGDLFRDIVAIQRQPEDEEEPIQGFLLNNILNRDQDR